jgi:hypothetical protein
VIALRDEAVASPAEAGELWVYPASSSIGWSIKGLSARRLPGRRRRSVVGVTNDAHP